MAVRAAGKTAGKTTGRARGTAASDRMLREDVASGCRILHLFGHEDMALGHVSARRPGAEAMLMKGKGLGLDEVTPAGVVPIDFQGRRLHRHARMGPKCDNGPKKHKPDADSGRHRAVTGPEFFYGNQC